MIVLRKTKLGESDLILTLLAHDGSQLRAVAKGARKPANTFAARLELYSVAEVLCSKGRNLDIIKEARLLEGNRKLRCDMGYAAGAAAMTELLDKVTQLGLSNPRLYDMTRAAFSSLEGAREDLVPSIAAAQLLKTLAFSGIRPSLEVCAACGMPVKPERVRDVVPVSYSEGGVLCEGCAASEGSVPVQVEIVKWAYFLLNSTFKEIALSEMGPDCAFEVLRFCQIWIREHVGANLKSLGFMLTSGLYETDEGI